MDDDIFKISFKKKNKNEQQLKNDILIECEIIGKSAWMKLAAKEKIDRDRSSRNKNNTSYQNKSNLPIINELTQLFKS